MKAIVTVVGHDRVGIIAGICVKLAEYNINVVDISQTILADEFTMVMAVDIEKMTVKFAEISRILTDLGREMQLSIHIQREEIFEAMHTI